MRAASLLLALIACAPPRFEPLPAPDAALAGALTHLRDVEAVDRPWVANGFIYYTRVDERAGRLYCRRAVEPGSPEQVLLAAPSSSLGAFGVSPDQRWLAFSTRGEGDRYALHLKDLVSGDVSSPIEGTDFAIAWAPDNTLFFAGLDEKDRPKKVYAVKPPSRTAKESAASARLEPRLRPLLVHEERDASREVLVAPLVAAEEPGARSPASPMGAGLFVRDAGGILGYRLHGGRDLEGLPLTTEHEGAEPEQGGSDLGRAAPAHPAVR